MILAVDVQYQNNMAFVEGVLFDDWLAEKPIAVYKSILYEIEEYVPGNFFKRELPCILELLTEHKLSPDCIVVDGYVYLDGQGKPGLGKKLFDSLGNIDEIIGVAKKKFSVIGKEYEIFRGTSKKPLYITTTGNLESAKNRVISMFGRNRIPAILKLADQGCRESAKNFNCSDKKANRSN